MRTEASHQHLVTQQRAPFVWFAFVVRDFYDGNSLCQVIMGLLKMGAIAVSSYIDDGGRST